MRGIFRCGHRIFQPSKLFSELMLSAKLAHCCNWNSAVWQLHTNHSLHACRERERYLRSYCRHFSRKTYYTRQRKSKFQGQKINTSHWLTEFSVTVDPYYIRCNFSRTPSVDSEAKNNYCNSLIRRKSDWLLHQVATLKLSGVHAP